MSDCRYRKCKSPHGAYCCECPCHDGREAAGGNRAGMTVGQRAAESKHWRWTPGMKWLLYRAGRLVAEGRVDDYDRVTIPPGAVPDLFDAATFGGLMALVRETRGCHYRTCPQDATQPDAWRAIPSGAAAVGRGATEAGALVSALLAE